MPTSDKTPLAVNITTTSALIDQFIRSLQPNTIQTASQAPPSQDSPSPLILLKASATSLKSQTTKLSLLAITNPFTPSAIVSCLQPINDSILPSLVTATLLTTPDVFTSSLSSECLSLSRSTLRDFQLFIRLLESRSKATPEVSQEDKNALTEGTGRIWEDCDELIRLSDEGVPGLVLRKTNQWLELMKDAVKELQEWDPEEEVDEDDLFGEIVNSSNGNSTNGKMQDRDGEEEDDDGNDHRATISSGVREQALKVLNRIPQAIHVVIKQRLEKQQHQPQSQQITEEQKFKLDTLLQRIRSVSELIDESAEAMYMGDPEQCLKKAGEARALTIYVVEAVLSPIITSPGEQEEQTRKEDVYIKRALEWIRQVDPGI